MNLKNNIQKTINTIIENEDTNISKSLFVDSNKVIHNKLKTKLNNTLLSLYVSDVVPIYKNEVFFIELRNSNGDIFGTIYTFFEISNKNYEILIPQNYNSFQKDDLNFINVLDDNNNPYTGLRKGIGTDGNVYTFNQATVRYKNKDNFLYLNNSIINEKGYIGKYPIPKYNNKLSFFDRYIKNIPKLKEVKELNQYINIIQQNNYTLSYIEDKLKVIENNIQNTFMYNTPFYKLKYMDQNLLYSNQKFLNAGLEFSFGLGYKDIFLVDLSAVNKNTSLTIDIYSAGEKGFNSFNEIVLQGFKEKYYIPRMKNIIKSTHKQIELRYRKGMNISSKILGSPAISEFSDLYNTNKILLDKAKEVNSITKEFNNIKKHIDNNT